MLTDWFEVHDERFRGLVLPNVHVERLFSEGRWLEGPVYVPAGRYLLAWQHEQLATGVPDCVLIAGRARQQTRDILYYRRSHRKDFRERCSCYWETVDFLWRDVIPMIRK